MMVHDEASWDELPDEAGTGYCPHCGEEISDLAVACPECGVYIEGGVLHQSPKIRARRQRRGRILLILAIIGLGLATIGGSVRWLL